MVAFIEAQGWQLDWLIETHVHADHLSGAPYIQGKLGGKIGIDATAKGPLPVVDGVDFSIADTSDSSLPASTLTAIRCS